MTSSATKSVKAFAFIALGLAIAVFAGCSVTAGAPLFEQPADVPSVSEPAPSPQWAAAVDRARPMVRKAVVEQNLPGAEYPIQHRHRGTYGHGRRGCVARARSHRR
jgi:hypothetical protein